MHGSVLQNKKYIKFADENTVEVMSLGRLDEAIKKGDRRAATYIGKDNDGKDVEFMLEWPGLTLEQITAMRSSKAASYNKTGKIPYTAIINPHTLEEMEGFGGNPGVGGLTDKITAHKKALAKQYGKGTSRKTLRVVAKAQAKIAGLLKDQKLAKAMGEYRKLEKKIAKASKIVQEKVQGQSLAAILTVLGDEVDRASGLLDRGEVKAAQKVLRGLKSVVKGTDLAEKVKDLTEKAKAAASAE